MSPVASVDTVHDARHPFGLPLGSVRGLLSLLICGFFWLVLLAPAAADPAAARPVPLLGHFFMLALVLLTFSPYSKGAGDGGPRFLPRLLRGLAVGGTAAAVAVALSRDPSGAELRLRLTPEPGEVQGWWATFLGTTAAGYAAGILVRMAFGRSNPVFHTLRAWTALVGLLLLAAELTFWLAIASAENKPLVEVRYWQAITLAAVSAYFGTRA